MAMHLSREACAKVQVQGQGGHVLLGVARAWATEVGRSQTFLPGTLASRKQGQWRSFRHGFCTAVLLGDHSGGRLVDKRQHGRPYAGATVRQLVDPHPGETERERERDDAFLLRRPGERVCVETSCFPFRSAPNTHGPARCLQAPGEDVGGEAAPAVHSGGPTRIPALKLSLALSPPARPRPRPLSPPWLSSAPEEDRPAAPLGLRATHQARWRSSAGAVLGSCLASLKGAGRGIIGNRGPIANRQRSGLPCDGGASPWDPHCEAEEQHFPECIFPPKGSLWRLLVSLEIQS